MDMNKTKTVYCDMDGVTASYITSTELFQAVERGKKIDAEQVINDFVSKMGKAGFFLGLFPNNTFIAGLRKFAKKHPEIPIKILSSLNGTPYCEDEKKKWLARYMPEFLETAIFVPCGHAKAEYVEDIENSILLDDFSRNLHTWASWGGTGVKVKNGINGRYGSWSGLSINLFGTPEEICKTLEDIVIGC